MQDFVDDSGSSAAASSSSAATDSATQTATESDTSGEVESTEADTDDVSDDERRVVPESFQKRFTQSRHEIKTLKEQLAEARKAAGDLEARTKSAATVEQENAALRAVLRALNEQQQPKAAEPVQAEPDWEFDIDDPDPAMRAAAKMERKLHALENKLEPTSKAAKEANFALEKQRYEVELTKQYHASLDKHAHLKGNTEAQKLAFALAHAGKDLGEAFDEVARLVSPAAAQRTVREAPKVIAPARNAPAPTKPITSLADAMKAADRLLDIKKR